MPRKAKAPASPAKGKGARGRPRKQIDVKLLERMARQHLTMEQMAYIAGVNPDTLYSRIAESAEFSEAIKRGRALGVDLATGKLVRAIQRGHMPSVFFFLKTQAGWRERAPNEAPEDEESVNAQLEALLARLASRGGGVAPPAASAA